MNNPSTSSPGAVAPASSRAVWLFAGVLVAIALTAGAGMLMRESMPVPVGQIAPLAQAPATTPAQVPSQAPVAEVRSPATTITPAPRPAARPVAAAAPVCHDCGVVESVRSITRKGEGSGLGAVAGGVIGAAVGNQFGKGNGRTAMTVLGAVGGGVAGNEVEKSTKSVTVHQVTVRMDDGSVRTIEQAQAPRTGERVIVQGNTLKPAPATAG